MSADPRGKCIIINNTSFTRMSERKGSTFDAVNVSELFRKLNFESEIWNDHTAEVSCFHVGTSGVSAGTFTARFCRQKIGPGTSR